MVLLSIGMAGLYSMTVVQTKQTQRLRNVLPPGDTPALNQAADQWARKLGVYASVEGAVTPRDPIVPYVYFEQVIDNLDAPPWVTTYKAPSDTYGWTAWNYYLGYRSNLHYHRSFNVVGSSVQFQASGLPQGEYEVLTTYPVFASLGTAIPHQIFDGGTLRATVKVNQTIAPAEVNYGGRRWDRLAVVQVNSGTLRVRLADGPGCSHYIVADAMLVRSARSMNLLSVTKTVTGGATAVLEAP
jgi:hypothetical protein